MQTFHCGRHNTGICWFLLLTKGRSNVVGEPRLVYTPGLPASFAMVLRGEFLHAAACGGQKATSTIAVLRVTPSGDMQGKPLNSKGWSRAG